MLAETAAVAAATPLKIGVFNLFPYYDYTATFLWAISGAMLGARRGYDLAGIAVVAIVSSMGGGLLRDGLFLQQRIPSIINNPVYPSVILAAVLAVAIFGGNLRRAAWLPRVLRVADSLALGCYAVVGMNLAMNFKIPIMGVALVGVANAVGGSILRDLVLSRPLELLRPGVPFAQVAVVGVILFLTLVHFGVDREIAGPITIVTVFVMRQVVVRLDLRSKGLDAFRDEWEQEPPKPSA